jgi:hypothetical protein
MGYRTEIGFIDIYLQDDQNGRKIMVLPSADKARQTHFTILSSEQPSLSADGNTMNLPFHKEIL